MAFQNEEIRRAPRPEEIIEIDFDALKARLAEEEEAEGLTWDLATT